MESSVDTSSGPDPHAGDGGAMSFAAPAHPSNPPPLLPPPHHSRQSSRRRPIDPSMHLKLRDRERDDDDDDDTGHIQIAPASPGVISSLITSLSVISQPAANHFDHASLSIPGSMATSPIDVGFGVEYGTHINPRDRLQEEEYDLNELAASSPVIRTSKPPSGFSAITAPLKSPRRDPAHGFKSLLRHSRPSSKGSVSSCQDDDTQSIGNLSIERGSSSELRKPVSQDGWGLKLGRGHKGLMYMSSRERLRANENGKRRVVSGGLISPSLPSPRLDQILAETPITEEPSHLGYYEGPHHERSFSADAAHALRPIPLRESSLREPERSTTRSSRKSSRQKNKEPPVDAVFEAQGLPYRQHSGMGTKKPWDDVVMRDIIDMSRGDLAPSKASLDASFAYENASGEPLEAPGIGDGAPSPAVYQNNRQSLQNTDRKKPGRVSPDSGDTVKIKLNSKSKRRSGASKTPEPVARKKDPASSEPVVGYERRGSADSIDDAVEAYLCAPRLTQKIQHPQTGRIISFSEVGDPEGSAVFCCVGMGLTRYITAFYDELALALKLRLITPDRPGVGDSEAHDGTTTPLSWPDDVYAICQTLKITKFSILAHSAGAIYALATALRMPQHIRGQIHLLAPWIPPSQMNVFGTTQALPPTNAIPTSQRILRALPTTFLKAANSSFMTATSSSITSSLPKSPRRGKRKQASGQSRDAGRDGGLSALDKENTEAGAGAKSSSQEDGKPSRDFVGNDRSSQDGILAGASDAGIDKERQTTYDLRLTHAIWDLATTGANPAVDLLVCLERRQTIGFRYVDITRPVVIHHGSRDTRVPVDNVRWLGKAMRRCEVRVLEGEGHGLMASASVMGSVLMEIGQEWDDWAKSASPKRYDDRSRSTRSTAVR